MTETDSSPATAPPSPGPSPWALAAAAAALAFAAFIPSLEGRFVNWDDEYNFVNNTKYRGLGPDQLRYFFTDLYGHYMPVTWMTLGLDHVLYGMNPAGYHRTSLLWHAACAWVFFFIALRLLRKALPDAPERALRWSTFAATLLFAIHPLRAESVAWITERRDVVSGLFFLLSVWAYLKHAGSPSPPGLKWLAISLACCVLSLLSKAMGMTLFFVLAVLDVYPLRRFDLRRPDRRVLLEKLPFAVLFVAMVLLTRLTQREATALYTADMYPWADRLLHPPYRIWFYVVKTVAPFGLSPLYPFYPVRIAGWGWFLVAAVAFVAVLALMLRFRRRWPALLASALAFGALIAAPVAWQAGPHFAADRYTYLACLPFALLFGAALARWAPARKPLAWTGALVLAALLTLSWRQAKVWKDSEALWTSAIEAGTPTEIPHMNRGVARAIRGKLDDAMDDLQEALRRNPREVMVWDNLSFVHRLRGETGKAVEAGTKAIACNPKLTNPHVNRALALVESGDYPGAVLDFSKALEIDPKLKDGHLNRALARQRAHDLEGAIDDAGRALELDPASARAFAARAACRTERREHEAALADFARARELDPKQAAPLVARGVVRAKAGDADGAIADYSEAIKQDPSDFLAFNNRGLARNQKNDLAGAMADYTEAIRLEPRHPDAWSNRSSVKAAAKDHDGVIADATEAIQLDPRKAEAFGNRGGARALKGDFKGAVEDFESALKVAPSDWPHKKTIQATLQEARKRLK